MVCEATKADILCLKQFAQQLQTGQCFKVFILSFPFFFHLSKGIVVQIKIPSPSVGRVREGGSHRSSPPPNLPHQGGGIFIQFHVAVQIKIPSPSVGRAREGGSCRSSPPPNLPHQGGEIFIQFHVSNSVSRRLMLPKLDTHNLSYTFNVSPAIFSEE